MVSYYVTGIPNYIIDKNILGQKFCEPSSNHKIKTKEKSQGPIHYMKLTHYFVVFELRWM